MMGSRKRYLTEVYKIIRGMERLARNQLPMISFNKGTKKISKEVSRSQAQNKHEKGVLYELAANLCNFLPMDTVNNNSLPQFKRTLDNYMEKKNITGY